MFSRLYRLIARAPNYVKQFGLLKGLSLLFALETPTPKESNEIRTYKVPGYRYPIHLRHTISDHSIFWQNVVRHQYDASGFKYHYSALKQAYQTMLACGETPLVIDCGGNIGLSVLHFTQEFSEARIVVVEPDDDNFKLLEKNIQPFGDKVMPLKGGIWNESGKLSIRNPDAGSAGFQVEIAEDGTIRAYTINEICTMVGVSAPFIVKVDIEGAQKQLFASNTSWVENAHLIVIELEDWLLPWQGTSQNFFKTLVQYPYEYLMAGDTLFCFRNTKQ